MDQLLNWLAPILSALVVCTGQLFLNSQFKRGDEKREEARAERAEIDRKAIEQRDAEHTIILAISRTMLLNNYEKCLNKGFYSVDERDVYSKLYEAYKDDGGNGVIATIAERIKELPTEPPKKEE